jgi:hypothetical protein
MVVEEVFGNRIFETTVYLAKPDGSRDMRVRLDEKGNVIDARLVTQPGRYTGRWLDGSNSLDGCGMRAFTEDKAKRLVELRCLQWLGEPMRDTSGVAVSKYTLDTAGFRIGERRYNIEGGPVADTSGVHAETYKRDSSGRLLLTQRFDIAGERVIDTSGCAGERNTYTRDGLLEETTCLGKNDAPIPDGDGVTIRRRTYDDNGCEVALRYRSPDGGEATDHRKRRGYDYGRDQDCTLVTTTCIGETGRAVACGPSEPAKKTSTVDANGRTISTKNFAPDGSPSGDAALSVHELRWKYDALGNPTDMTCWNVDGSAAECGTTGFHGWHKTYDDAGHALVQTFVDKTGAPGTNMGISQRRYRYDNYDHLHESLFIDARGELFEARGSAIQRSLWDASHRLFGYQLLDASGKPARYNACFMGMTCPKKDWHAVRIHRRPNGRVESNQFFDAEGQLIESIDCSAKQCLGG